MPKNGRSKKNRTGFRNGTKRMGGPTPTPTTTLTRKLSYVEHVSANNTFGSYAYYSAYVAPDVSKVTGAIESFNAFELWRLKNMKVSLIISANNSASAGRQDIMSQVASTIIWTAADFGKNESVSGETIMTYQNAKRSTPSLNAWKTIVNTKCKLNNALGTSSVSNYILPADTWLNTTFMDSSAYSGYQMYIQCLGYQDVDPSLRPYFALQTELEIEFLQPAFQTMASSFQQNIFKALLDVIPDPLFPDVYRTYVFERLIAAPDIAGNPSYRVVFVRQDGVPGQVIYTDIEFKTLWNTKLSGPHFGNRRVKYIGPEPSTYRT